MNPRQFLHLGIILACFGLLISAITLWRDDFNAPELPVLPKITLPDCHPEPVAEPRFSGYLLSEKNLFHPRRGTPEEAVPGSSDAVAKPPRSDTVELLGIFSFGSEPGAIIANSKKDAAPGRVFRIGDTIDDEYILSEIGSDSVVLEYPGGTLGLPLKGLSDNIEANFARE